ncbi:MAG: PaaI family thioesterase [Planctomycetota bacterium]
MKYQVAGDGAVVGDFDCDPTYQSYPDRLHGGIVAVLLDEAMAHCLLQRGVIGITGRLNIGFREPIIVGTPLQVRAKIISEAPDVYRVQGEIWQDDRLRARAEGKFTPRDDQD